MPFPAAALATLVAVAFLPACVSYDAQPAPPSTFEAAADDAQPPPGVDCAYTFRLVDAERPEILVTVACPGDGSGATTFAFSERFGNVEPVVGGVRDVRVLRPRGAPPPVAKIEDRAWTARHRPGEPVAAVYALTVDRSAVGAAVVGDQRPLADDGFFHAVGGVVCAYPAHLAGPGRFRFAVRWRGFAEAGWRTWSSFGDGPDVRTETSLDEMRRGLFVAGKMRVVERPSGDGDVVVLLRGDGLPMPDGEIADFAARIRREACAFFEDRDAGRFLLALVEAGTSEPLRHRLAGMALTEGLSLVYSRPQDHLEEFRRSLRHVIVHELIHVWNGGTLAAENGAEDELLWFTEGFTDFYARRLLVRAGYVRPRRAVDEINRTVQDYAANRWSRRRLADAAERQFVDADAQRLPYLRGELAARLADYEIRRASDGRRSLDDLMRGLLRRFRESPGPLSSHHVLTATETLTSRAFARRLAAFVFDGLHVELPGDLLAPAAEPSGTALETTAVAGDPDDGPRRFPVYRLRPAADADDRRSLAAEALRVF